MPDDNGNEKQFRTTEINLQAKPKKRILGVSPAFFWVCITVFALVILLGAVSFTLILKKVNGYNRIYPGVSAFSVELGGLTESEAVSALNEYSENYFSAGKIFYGN